MFQLTKERSVALLSYLDGRVFALLVATTLDPVVAGGDVTLEYLILKCFIARLTICLVSTEE